MSYPVYSTGFPYTAVVYLETTFADGSLSGGTGVVVGQNDILTASHVVFNASRGGAAVEVTAYPGRNGGSKPFGRFNAASIDYLDSDKFSDSLMSRKESASDIAILGFNEDIRSQTGAFELDPDSDYGFYNKTGYPGIYSGIFGPRLINDVSYTWKRSYGAWWTLGFDLNNGDSGGPIWHYVDGVPNVVGVVSTRQAAASVDRNYDQLLDWIDGNDILLGDQVVQPGPLFGYHLADLLEGSWGADQVTAGDGQDTISGRAGDDLIYGNRDIDWIDGGSGEDTIFGGQNNGPETENNHQFARRLGIETIMGGGGNDYIYGNHGGDSIDGGSGDDFIFGGQDNDRLYGGAGSDLIAGNKNDDILSGGDGNDVLDGGSGNDLLIGGPGDDRLQGGDGHDEILGGLGADVIDGGAGDDMLGGGDGIDMFIFSSNSGNDHIVDGPYFREVIHVQADINGTDITTAFDLLARLSDNSNGEAVLDLGAGNTVTFTSYSRSWFYSSDFYVF